MWRLKKLSVVFVVLFYVMDYTLCISSTAATIPASEPEGSTSEPNTESEVGTSEPETESTNEPETESGTSEPETEPEGGTSEPETEPEGGTSKPETEPEGGTSEPETEPEGGTSEMEPEDENSSSEPESESETETEPENLPEGEERPSPFEIIGPPFIMIAILILGLLCLSLYTRRVVIKRHFRHLINHKASTRRPLSPPNKVKPVDVSAVHNNVNIDEKQFLTNFDLEVMANLGSFNNRPLELLRIASPALLSLFLCPFTLYLYSPLVSLFWDQTKVAVFPPDINEAIACFLAPAGLVYATSFGFAFQQALHKQSETLRRVTHELGLLDQIVSMASKMQAPTLKQKMDIYRAVKAEAVFMALQIENRDQFSFKARPTEDVRVKIWTMMDTIRNMAPGSPTATYDLDKILADKIISHTLELNSICSDRMGVLHSRIHPLKWAFLESLGFFSFFGILLIRAESYRMELIMCIITVFSISLMCYVVSDLDSPFSGFFKVDVTVLPEVIFRAKRMYDRARLGDNRLCEYPERQ